MFRVSVLCLFLTTGAFCVPLLVQSPCCGQQQQQIFPQGCQDGGCCCGGNQPMPPYVPPYVVQPYMQQQYMLPYQQQYIQQPSPYQVCNPYCQGYSSCCGSGLTGPIPYNPVGIGGAVIPYVGGGAAAGATSGGS